MHFAFQCPYGWNTECYRQAAMSLVGWGKRGRTSQKRNERPHWAVKLRAGHHTNSRAKHVPGGEKAGTLNEHPFKTPHVGYIVHENDYTPGRASYATVTVVVAHLMVEVGAANFPTSGQNEHEYNILPHRKSSRVLARTLRACFASRIDIHHICSRVGILARAPCCTVFTCT